MQYSIRSRFYGTLLGLAIGEKLGKFSSCKSCLSYNQIPQNSNNAADAQVLRLVVPGMKSLIQTGRFDSVDWECAFSQDLDLDPLQSIIATLPIALFYHENEIKLRQNLQLALLALLGQEEPEIRDGALIVGYVIAKSVQAQPKAAELISQTVDFLGEPHTQTAQKLIQVKSLLEQNAGLERAITALNDPQRLSGQIAIAFYCCLSTLEDFRLSTKRVARQIEQPEFTSAITGAFSGAYNGLAGIPSGLKSIALGMTTETEMLRLCDSLLAVWSGVYEQAQPADLTQIAAISAPSVMRRH